MPYTTCGGTPRRWSRWLSARTGWRLARRSIDAFNRGALGTNVDLRVRLPATVFQGDFKPRFALKTALKDITPATELAEEVGVQVQLAEACKAEMNEALERGLGGLDSSVALTLQEKRAGVHVRLA